MRGSRCAVDRRRGGGAATGVPAAVSSGRTILPVASRCRCRCRCQCRVPRRLCDRLRFAFPLFMFLRVGIERRDCVPVYI